MKTTSDEATTPDPASAMAIAAAASTTIAALEQDISARYLSLIEREQIADMLAAKKSIRAIAKALGRDPGSISREISRNSHPVLGYQPYGAHRRAATARARPKISKLSRDGELREYVKEKLLTRWPRNRYRNC